MRRVSGTSRRRAPLTRQSSPFRPPNKPPSLAELVEQFPGLLRNSMGIIADLGPGRADAFLVFVDQPPDRNASEVRIGGDLLVLLECLQGGADEFFHLKAAGLLFAIRTMLAELVLDGSGRK